MKKLAIVLLLVTTSCVAMKNSSTSPIQDKNGKKVAEANVSVVSKYDQGTVMTVTTSDGEIYKGEVVGDTVASEYSDDMMSVTSAGARYYSKGYAMLISPSGNSMECSVRLSRPSKSIAWGGGGECKLSNGNKLPFTLLSSNRNS